MAASLRRAHGIRLPSGPHGLSSSFFRSVSSFVCDLQAADEATFLERSSSRVWCPVEAIASGVSGSSCVDLGRQPQCDGAAGLDDFFLYSGSWASGYGGLMSRNAGVQEVLGFGARGFASKAKKSGGKARSDDSGGQVLASPGPSAKETATRLMEAALNALSVELSKLRTGRASPGMLDHVNVMAHGVLTPLAHVAAVSVSNIETLTVMPYDASMVKEVEKAILGSPLRLNPVPEGQVLRVPIPKLTKEHIQSMSKLVGKAGETAKLSLRRARKDAMDLVAKGGFSMDEVKRYEKEVEDVTKKYVKLVEEACKLKEKEILGNG